jgi:hypothetical protein
MDFTDMFNGATEFNRKINSWNINENDITTDMLTNSGLVNNNLYGFTSGTPSFTLFNQPICFNKGTQILCFVDNKEQYIPIQQMRKGTLVKTYKHGYKPIEVIKTRAYRLGRQGVDQGMYRMKKSGSMIADLEMTGLHSILVDETDPVYANQIKRFEMNNAKYKRPWGWYVDGKFRLTANSCAQFKKMPVSDYNIYSFVLDNQQMQYGVWANGVLVETTTHRYIKQMTGAKDVTDELYRQKKE